MEKKGFGSRSDKSVTPRKLNRKKESPEWVKNLSRYDKANLWRAIEQLVGTFVPYFLILSLMLMTIQHNFPGTYFVRQNEWDHLTASLRGASHYKLPPVFQWATGNIGFHHAHHVRPRIPNYNLPRSYKETKELHVRPLTIRRSLDGLFLSLWDEDKNKLVSFRDIKKLKRKRIAGSTADKA